MRGIEPLTFALRTRRSAKLSYIPCGSKKAKVKSKKVCYSAFDLFPILDFQSNDIFYFCLFTCSMHRVSGQQRTRHIRGKSVAFFDFADYTVEQNIVRIQNNYDIARTIYFFINLKLDNSGVAADLTQGFVFKIFHVKTQRLTKTNFHFNLLAKFNQN
jgi:hypothetical protein